MAIRSLVAVLLVFASAIVAAQQRPVFRAEANYIEISAVVTDKLGSFVSGLTQADFEVREGRARRDISTFSRFDAEAASSPGAPTGRVYLLVVDSPYAQETDKTCRSLTMARQFVEGFVQPGDTAAVWDGATGQTTFKADPAELLQQLKPSVLLPPLGEMYAMSSTLASAVTALDGIQGRRKSLLFFSCGRTPPIWNYSLPADTLDLIGRHYGREAGFTLANRPDVHIYPCDARGLRTGAVTADQRGNASARSRNGNLIGEQLMFDEIAEATGGTAITGSNDYAPAFARIVEDNSHYYLLGYRAPDRPKNGQFVSLNVKVKRDGLRVRARKGYFAK